MNVREMAGAFIFNGDRILLMKRAMNRKLAPGLWGPVGGHVEPEELGNPRAACLREIYEESGLYEEDFESMDLKYILFRRENNEIRQHYLFIGKTGKTEVIDKTAEGTLHWVNTNEIANLKMSFTVKSALIHYLKEGLADQDILTGTVSAVNGLPVMHWNTLDHWNGMQ